MNETFLQLELLHWQIDKNITICAWYFPMHGQIEVFYNNQTYEIIDLNKRRKLNYIEHPTMGRCQV